MNTEQNNIENQEATDAIEETRSTPPTLQPLSQEAVEIVLNELHAFAADLHKLIADRENKLERLSKQRRDTLADALASAPNARS